MTTDSDDSLQNDAECNEIKNVNTEAPPANETTPDCTTEGDATNNNDVSSLQARRRESKSLHARDLQNLGTRIDAGILKAFKTYVLSKYGRLNKVFSLEIEDALEHYLKCPNKQHHVTSNTFLENPATYRSDTQAKLELMAQAFLVQGSYPDLSAETIKKIITNILVKEKDRRTHARYLAIIRKDVKEKPSGFSLYSIFDVSRFCEKTLGMTFGTVQKRTVEAVPNEQTSTTSDDGVDTS